MSRPLVGVVGGLDPTGGAGILRDAWTVRARAPDWDLRAVVTALTRQGRGRCAVSRAVGEASLRRRLEPLGSGVTLAAIKVGLVPEQLAGALVERSLAPAHDRGVPVVLDPVLRASDGGDLGGAVAGYVRMAPSCTLCTPNVPEGHAFAGRDDLHGASLAAALRSQLDCDVLLKGGHAAASDDLVVDLLATVSGVEAIERPRVPGADVRGTGCALASAIAVELGRGVDLSASVRAAVTWLDRVRRRATPGPDGRLHLPWGGD